MATTPILVTICLIAVFNAIYYAVLYGLFMKLIPLQKIYREIYIANALSLVSLIASVISLVAVWPFIVIYSYQI